MTDNDILDSMSDAWAARHGLRRNPSYSGQVTLLPLFTGTNHELVRSTSDAHFGDALLDHSRAFKAIGTLRDSVLASAPYEQSLLRRIGPPARIVDEIWALADALALRVRIGNPNDRTYTGSEQTLPIVWWDPERISLPYAPLT